MKTINVIFAFIIASTILSSCTNNNEVVVGRTFGIFKVKDDNKTVEMDGEIQSRTLQDFNNILQGYPNINLINIKQAPGSRDDESNFQIGVILRQKKINTHLLNNADAASGGVDFFLAGVARTRGSNTRLGVHAWSDSDGNEATDFPINSDEHRANIKYYEDLGYTPQWANDFYFFTINAASADNIHWMSEDEINQYNLITP